MSRAFEKPQLSERRVALAADLFWANGYAATGIRQLAKAFDLETASLYHYVDKKEDILYAICRAALQGSLREISQILDSDIDPEVKLDQFIDSHVKGVLTAGRLHAVMLTELRSLTQAHKREVLQWRRDYERCVRRLVSPLVSDTRSDTTLPAMAILGMLNWTIFWYRDNGKEPIEEIIRFMAKSSRSVLSAA